MPTKLTLSMDKEVIKKAKTYAAKSNRSLSEIVEKYLAKITDDELGDVDHELRSLIGVIKLPDDFDEKKAIKEILTKKHL